MKTTDLTLTAVTATLIFGALACSDNVDSGCVSDSECAMDRVCSAGSCGPKDPSEAPDETTETTPERSATIDVGPFADVVYETALEPVSGYSNCDRFPSSGMGFRLVAFLHHDGFATVFYDEGILGHGFNETSSNGLDEDSRWRFDSRWGVEDEIATVGDLLTCEADTFEGSDRAHLSCTLQRDLFECATESNVIVLEPGLELDELPTDPAAPEYDAFRPAE